MLRVLPEVERFKKAYDETVYGMPSEEVNFTTTARPNYKKMLAQYKNWTGYSGDGSPYFSDPEQGSKFKSLFGKSSGYGLASGGRVGLMGGAMPTGIMRSNQAGVMERDYRDEGGFVPVGIKEKADDVPAMLSKNEFVFTADAVRGAGNGSIEKGAQKMYDTMKNLERRVV
jgi:hypothetical protein